MPTGQDLVRRNDRVRAVPHFLHADTYASVQLLGGEQGDAVSDSRLMLCLSFTYPFLGGSRSHAQSKISRC